MVRTSLPLINKSPLFDLATEAKSDNTVSPVQKQRVPCGKLTPQVGVRRAAGVTVDVRERVCERHRLHAGRAPKGRQKKLGNRIVATGCVVGARGPATGSARGRSEKRVCKKVACTRFQAEERGQAGA